MSANQWNKEIPTKEEWQAFKKEGSIKGGLCSEVKMGDEFNYYAANKPKIDPFKSKNIMMLQHLSNRLARYERAFLEKYPKRNGDKTHRKLKKVQQAIQKKLESARRTNPTAIPSKAQWKTYQAMMQIPERLCDDEVNEVDLGNAFQSYHAKRERERERQSKNFEEVLEALEDLSTKLTLYETNLLLNDKYAVVFDGKHAASLVRDDIVTIKANVTRQCDMYYKFVHPVGYFFQMVTIAKKKLDLLDGNEKERMWVAYSEDYRNMGTAVSAMVTSKDKAINVPAKTVQAVYRTDQIIVDETAGPERLAAMKKTVEDLISISKKVNLWKGGDNNGAQVYSIDLDVEQGSKYHAEYRAFRKDFRSLKKKMGDVQKSSKTFSRRGRNDDKAVYWV
mmetsp:Transcript_25660/g.37922  ORF Transcript_25660/g.37922 Transcript_25660/m.37922 type:complete len:392 (-) Transcript_25660:92-1267(-)